MRVQKTNKIKASKALWSRTGKECGKKSKNWSISINGQWKQ
jgi:plasmid maintenance system killer protein